MSYSVLAACGVVPYTLYNTTTFGYWILYNIALCNIYKMYTLLAADYSSTQDPAQIQYKTDTMKTEKRADYEECWKQCFRPILCT